MLPTSPKKALYSLLTQGRALLDKDDFALAANIFNQAIELDSTDPDARMYLADALRKLGRYEDAIKMAESSLALNPIASVTSNLWKRNRSKNNQWKPHLTIVYSYVGLGQYDRAETIVRSILEKEPGNVSCEIALAYVLETTNQLELTADLYQKLFVVLPNSEFIGYSLGRVYRKLGRIPEAIAAFKRTIEINALHLNAHLGLAAIYFSQEQWEEAEKFYRAVILIDPNKADVYFNLGILLNHSDDRAGAIVMMEKAIALKPDYEQAHYSLGLYKMLVKNYSQSLDSFQKAIALNGQKADYYDCLGNVLMCLDKPEAALTAYEYAVVIESNHAKAHSNLALLYSRQGRHSEAKIAIEKLAELGETALLEKLKNRMATKPS